MNNPAPLPSRDRQMPGRPSIKRKKDRIETQDWIVRPPRTMTCTNCHQTGHNKAKCTSEKVELPQKILAKRGRPQVEHPINSRVNRPKGGRTQTIGRGDTIATPWGGRGSRGGMGGRGGRGSR